MRLAPVLTRVLAASWLITLITACQKSDPPPVTTPPPTEQASPQDSPSSDTASTTDPTALMSVATGADSNEVLQVGVGACSADACPIEVRLLQAAQVKDVTRLEWTSMSNEVEPASPDSALGPTDPLRVEQDLRVWSVGQGEQAVLVGIRSVQLQGRKAVLVDQVVGFDHLSRRHELYAAFDGKLVNVWSSVQPQGPHWSAVSILSGASGGDTLVRILGFEPDTAQPATVTAEAFVFEPAQRIMRSTDQRVQLGAAKLGPYATVEAARNERADCLDAFWVIDAKQLGGKGAKDVLLVAFGVDITAAKARLDQAVECAPQVKPLGVDLVTLPTGN